MVLYNNKKLLAALGGYQRHDGHYVCNLHNVPCTSPGLATVVAEVSREKKRVILKRKLNLLHVEYEENADGSVYNCRHDACLRRVDPQPPTAADALQIWKLAVRATYSALLSSFTVTDLWLFVTCSTQSNSQSFGKVARKS